MNFQRLTIERVRWGDDKGKIKAELAIDGRKVDMVIRLSDSVGDIILKQCAEEICVAATEEAASFRSEFLASINPHPEPPEPKETK